MSEIEDIHRLLQKLKGDKKELREGVDALVERLHMAESRLEQSQRDLHRMKRITEESEKRQQETISICAHDLKSPINSFLSFLEILVLEGPRLPPQEVKQIYQRMDRTGRHMWKLVNDLLDSSKIDSGTVTLNMEPTLLSNLCRDAVETAQGQLNDKAIEATVTVRPPELKVNLDHPKTSQIINNLLSNAIKFTPRGGQIHFEISGSEHRKIALLVRDSGQGIPKDELKGIFEKFKQTSTRSTEGEKGSGLGLSIVQQLVKLQKGEVRVESEVGRGTTFHLEFPVAESPVLLKLFSGK